MKEGLKTVAYAEGKGFLSPIDEIIEDLRNGRMIILVDAEAYMIPYKEAYDKKGELWKIILNCPKESADPKAKPMELGVSLAIDLQAEHATAVAARSAKSNVGLDPQLFTVASLRKRGH